jgi:microcin C transport system substrate-binding protein
MLRNGDLRWLHALLWATALLGPAQAVTPGPASAPVAWSHSFAAYGDAKYAPGFSHWDYVNPQAPKGGTLYLRNPDRRSSFDKFNTFTLLGNAPAGMGIFMTESLAVLSADEPRTMYGLLAQDMAVAPDRSSVTFRLNPLARFSNGDPVLALDVKYSFDSQSGPYASPTYSGALTGVASATVLDQRTIRFDLKDKNSDTVFKVGTMFIFSHKWGLKPDGTHVRFDEIRDEYPLTTGPYTISVADSGRRLELQRNPRYWARDLPERRGMFNFDRIVYRYYQDEDVATEALKAGEFDITRVYGARIWMRQLVGPKWESGQIVKKRLPFGTGQGLQSYQINLRRPLFQDIRVREALGLAYDFEQANRYGLFKRANSMFNNSEFAAVALPSPGELRLLEPYRSSLPADVFGPAFVGPINGEAAALRRNLLKARSLLQAAGWHLAAGGKLRNAKGVAFEFEYLAPGDSVNDARLNAWAQNLAKLGIHFKVRNVDFALYDRRLQDFDFDIVTIVEGSFTLPSSSDYTSYYGSKAADEKGSNNLRGVKSAAADHALAAMTTATTMTEFTDACRALDRIVMWSHWQVPELYQDNEPIAYWDKFGMPAVLPRFFTADLAPDVDPQLPWPITTWWAKPATATP